MWFVDQALASPNPAGFIEKVNSWADEGGSAAHSFGRRHGELTCHYVWASIPFEYIDHALTWQHEFNLGGEYASKPEKKQDHRRVAQILFGVEMTIDVCDAYLIAEYGYRKTFGGLTGGKIHGEIRPGTGVVSVVQHSGRNSRGRRGA